MTDVNKPLKVLVLLTTGLRRADRELERRDGCPRASLFEDELNADMLYESSLAEAPFPLRLLYRWLPVIVAQVIEGYRIRKRYDVVLSWSDPHGMLFSLLLKLTRSKVRHIAMLAWISKPKKARLLKRVYSHMSRIILWTSAHREFAVNTLKIPPAKIRLLHYFVDQQFWRPVYQGGDMICSAGVEMRDYPTLIEAMRGLEIPCHIAAGIARGKLFDTVTAIYAIQDLPATLTVGSKSATEMRDLYAGSRFVVVPLLPSESDNGLTVILEAMAMGKAVICSRTKGQRDVIIDGVTGIYVPQGDPTALRDAIMHFWNHPGIAERMGRAGRKRIEEEFTWDAFVQSIKQTVEEVAGREFARQTVPYQSREVERVYATRS